VTFPLIGTDSEPRVDITSTDIADALETEDIERYGQ
jgi:hypothetical protein